MKPAIFTSFDDAIDFERALPMIRAAGFDVVAISGSIKHVDYTTVRKRAAIGQRLRENRLSIDSVHAPFPEGDRLFSLDENERSASLRQCQAALDTAAELNGKMVVIHLIQPYDIPHGEMRDRMIAYGRQSVQTLAAYAADKEVKLALENGQRRDYDQVLIDLLDELNEAHVGLCYDSGHEHVQGRCFELLERFADRLFTLHVHDNKGSDTHTLPYEGTIDWDKFRSIIHGLNYAGHLLLEVGTHASQFKEPVLFLTEAWKRAERLITC